MIASTNDAFCPTLRASTDSALPDGVNSVLEFVLDGLDADAIRRAMRAGIDAACRPGVLSITAGNYGGNLGKHQFHLREDHERHVMSERVTLTLRAALDGALEVDGVAGDRFATLSEGEIAALPVWLGARTADVGDFFDIDRRALVDRPRRRPRRVARVNGLGADMVGGRTDDRRRRRRRVGAA